MLLLLVGSSRYAINSTGQELAGHLGVEHFRADQPVMLFELANLRDHDTLWIAAQYGPETLLLAMHLEQLLEGKFGGADHMDTNHDSNDKGKDDEDG